ncbi:MAG: hypothetical protein AAGK38_01480, partial [Pseudomonadota bacterium]
MKDIASIETAILDNDGSFRDVNFLRSTWVGVAALIEKIEESYSRQSSNDGEGNMVPEPLSECIVNRALETGSVHICYE